ncbi:MAG: DNA-directed RNA polymerase [Nanoarchaeota archaeon]|nr:DNA-directed RNA polymerase [Nanoarchaeota archaeon]
MDRGFGRSRQGGGRSFGGGGRSNFGGPREMHKAVCSECKKECEVPFKPTEGKPVYCRDCFRNKKAY